MRLKLERPLVSIDFETATVKAKPDPTLDRIVQIGFKKMMPKHPYVEIYTRLVNPTIPISASATAIHGITDSDVEDKPTFAEIANEVFAFISMCDITGYCVLSYDSPLLYSEFLRAGIIWDYSQVKFIDSANIARRKEPRDLKWAMKFYCDQEAIGNHAASFDANAAANVLYAQVEKYDDMPCNVAGLALYSNNDKPLLDLSGKFAINDVGSIVFNFGKHVGKSIDSEVDYLHWMLNADFAADTKAVIKKQLGIKQ